MRRHLFVLLVLLAIMGSIEPPSHAAAPTLGRFAGSSSTTIAVFHPTSAPCDTPPFCSADIRIASERSYIGGTGRRMLAVTVVAYEPPTT